jgi:GntR family transcriptional regulator / MocR family aminotransferase
MLQPDDAGTRRYRGTSTRPVGFIRTDAVCPRRRFGNTLAFDLPAGGLALWLRLPEGDDSALWAEHAAKIGLSVMPGPDFALTRATARQAFRLGYASLDDSEIHRVVDLLARSRPVRCPNRRMSHGHAPVVPRRQE